jgi:predicted negative regulator of RcsB-dependent stress response
MPEHGFGPGLLGPWLAMVFGLILAVLFCFGYTAWAINEHSHQACTELQILATAPGAVTPYDMTVKAQYQHLYTLRCG